MSDLMNILRLALPPSHDGTREQRRISISPLEGEMPGRAEGGSAAYSSLVESAAPPPSVISDDISPSRGEIGSLPHRSPIAGTAQC
ncbi:Hypothetical protein NGAL_HAMBI2427_27590 [Neorhizobium galegae bv. orientalis]|uniref:Propionyl-coenzyme A carboxylase alpha polypeptide n=1 Tax=Neorhizobium galegae bv. orientalis str. HAMBI 540 TaxID=1028800 RepID=A0A068SZE6_NEOGA|nr:Hypothetical protein RG540_CH43990 [Neorhizobium galegae bv. orientalis str. HAMBI 540]CDZ48666.1 Hypothetical protein NGAL_HAMBI2427_27590 [Neorhizobium galegae bv. orientalis]